MHKKNFIIENFGCQMNLADSQELINQLTIHGFNQLKNKNNPDIIIINSCAVRKSAEEKIYSHLKYYHFNKYAKQKIKPIYILIGCVAQKEKYNIITKMPWIDLVIGTHQKHKLPNILTNYIKSNNQNLNQRVYSKLNQYKFMETKPSNKYPFKAELTIIHGCNKFCSYCIVPYTRGKETSRNHKDIIENIKSLTNKGVSEIMLLGQNVNSYGKDINDINFPELLYKINKINNGLKRIRFLTSHPIDFNDELIYSIKEAKKICRYIHLPLQSASNNVLDKMKREYNFEHYINIINKLKKNMPNISLSTDILVGFPYETEKDFEETINAVKTIQFDTAYMFKYSPRQGTPAYQYHKLISPAEKQRRLSHLINIQLGITKKQNQKNIGKIEEILIESQSKNNPKELLGKTNNYKNVVIKAHISEIGKYKTVQLKKLNGNTFYGNII